MKNCLNLCILFSLFFLSCSENIQEKEVETFQKNDLEKENLKGDIIMILDENDWDLSFTSYNSDGYIETIFMGSNNSSFFYEEFSYVNRLLTSRITNGYGEEKTEVLSYDEENNLISRELPKVQSQFYFYDDYNKLIRDSIYYHYDPTKFAISNYYYKSDGSLDSLTYNHNLFPKDSETYIIQKFVNSKPKENINYLIQRGEKKLSGKIEFEYNENGDIFKRVEEDFIENKKSITTYKYVYDKNNNWIKSEEFINNNPEHSRNRKIFYKGDDVSSLLSKKIQIINSIQGSIGSNRVPSLENNSQSGGSINQEDNSSQKRKCSQCNGSGQCSECSKTFRKNYYKGNGPYDDRNETKPGFILCSDCRGRGHKQEKRNAGGWEPGGDCHVSGCMDGWIYCRSCNHSGNGRNIGKCDRCKGTGQE